MVTKQSNFENDGTNDHVFQQVSKLVIPLMGEVNRNTNQVEALGVGCSAVFAAVTGCAYIVGQTDGLTSDSPDMDHMKTINPATSLVAALIAVKASSSEWDDNGNTVSMELNPIVYLAAIKAAEMILGRNIDKELNPGLVSAARRWEAEHGYSGTWEEQNSANKIHGGHAHLH